MYTEGNDLNISHYSICFPVAFRAESGIIDKYFADVKVTEDYINCKNSFVTELNSAVVKHNRHNNLLVAPRIESCLYGEKDCQNYACRCLRLASVFHDDYLIDNKIMQVSLGRADVAYTYAENDNTESINFAINLILHITNEDPTTKSESNKINYNTQLIFEVHDNGTNAQRLIFLKHLFYKRSLKCAISYGNKATEQISITDWANNIIYDLIDSFANKRTKENNRYSHFCFDSSFAEINIDTDEEVSGIYKNHSNELCGVLMANEEYKFLSEKYVDESLESQWGCYESSLYYFLNGSVLNVRSKFKEAYYTQSLTKCFAKYKRQDDSSNKYIDRTEANNCIAGLKDVVLYLYLDCNKKRFVLQEAIDDATKILKSRSLSDIQKRQNKINTIISTYPHGAIGRFTLDQRMVSMFYIESLSESLRDCNGRMSALVESLHNKRLNRIIIALTTVTVLIPLGIFAVEQGWIDADIAKLTLTKCLILAALIMPSVAIYKMRDRFKLKK